MLKKIFILGSVFFSFSFTAQWMDFIEISALFNGKYISNVYLNNDGTVFTRNSRNTIKAYDFIDSCFVFLDSVSVAGNVYDILFNDSDKVFVGYGDNAIKVFDFSNNQFELETYFQNYGRARTMALIGQDTLVLASFEQVAYEPYLYPEVIWSFYYYRYSDGNLDSVRTVKIQDYYNGTSQADPEININSDLDIAVDWQKRINFVYRGEGLHVITWDRQSINTIASEVYCSPWGTVFISDYKNNVCFCDEENFDRNVILELRRLPGVSNFSDLTFIDNQQLFIADRQKGIKLFSRNGELYELCGQNDSIGIALSCANNNGILFVARAWDGMSAYKLESGVSIKDNEVVGGFVLNDNYPNPFNPLTKMSYKLPEQSDVKIIIHDICGRSIQEWTRENQSAGIYEITWDAKDQSGNTVPSGVYIYTLVAGDHVESKKMVLLK